MQTVSAEGRARTTTSAIKSRRAEVLASLTPNPVTWKDGCLQQSADAHANRVQQTSEARLYGHPQNPVEPETEVRTLQDRGQLSQAVLAEHLATEHGTVAKVYAAIREDRDITTEVLQSAG